MTLRRFESLLAVLLLAGCTSDAHLPPSGWEFVWADECDGTVIDQEKWTPLVMPDPPRWAPPTTGVSSAVGSKTRKAVWLAEAGTNIRGDTLSARIARSAHLLD
jgi:hypothetical protein